MPQPLVRSPRDLGAGILYLAIALLALWFGRTLERGTATRMGPGYFPLVLGVVLGGLGLVAIARAFLLSGDRIGALAWRPLALVLAAPLVFAALLRPLGLVLALPALVLVSAAASRRFRLAPTLLLALALTVVSALVFVTALGVPLPLWPAFATR